MTSLQVTSEQIIDQLRTVMDPELNVDIVSLGLIYQVEVSQVQTKEGEKTRVHILMTLTTPGCPLAPTIADMIRQSLDGVNGFDAYLDLSLELTFDPPWIPAMMDAETRAELGLDE